MAKEASASPPLPDAVQAGRPSVAPPAPVGTGVADRGDWCEDGWSALSEDVCYVLPTPAEGKPRRLLVYLHGIVPPRPQSPQKHAVQDAVLRACRRAQAAALVPRGVRGVGPAQAVDWWAWPTTPTSIARLAPSIVLRWQQAKEKLEALAGAPFERTYVAGSSNGAYFLTALAIRGDLPTAAFPVDGFGAMSGGAAGPGATERLATASPRPFYVGFGTYDEETKAGARALAAAVHAAHWPLRVAEHPLPHGASEVYIDEAFEFWDEPDTSADAP
jgi:predicted esterase